MTTKTANFLNRHLRMSGTALPACEEEQAGCLFHYTVSTDSNKSPENTGWNLMRELNANNGNAKVRTYIWGLDLSGTMQGAGGVGGLLMLIDHTGTTKRHYAAYDGNGNVMGLADSTTGKWSARYEYGPFGEPVRANGDFASANPMRWSTKYTDGESGLVYYGYRSYNPSTGRWLNRDALGDEAFLAAYVTGRPWREQLWIGEESLKPAYAFVANNPIDQLDPLGLLRFDSKCDPKDIEKMKKDLKDKCEKAKKGNCFRCLKQKGQDALSKMCDEIDKNTGPKVFCEDASSDKGCKDRTYCGWERFGKIHVCVDLMQDTRTNCGEPGCVLLHEGGHAVGGVGYDGDDAKRPDNRGFAIEKCAGCYVPSNRTLPPGY